MRHPILVPVGLVAALALAACDKEIDKDAVDRPRMRPSSAIGWKR